MNDIEKIQEYVPTVYVNDSEPDLNETNLNKTEEALKRVTDAANKAIDALKQLEQEKLSLSAISSVLSDANDKVPSLALVNAMQKEIDETNSNFGNTNNRISSLEGNFINGFNGTFKASELSTVPINGWCGTLSSAVVSGGNGWTAMTLNIGESIRYRLQIESTGQLTMYRTLDNFANIETKIISPGW